MPEINPEEFAIPFFTQQNFTRRKCPNCGSYFWSQNPNQTTCGEAPCAPYTFIGNPPTTRRYTVPEMRIQFMDYFADNGHTRIPPYPIVARWRNDVYLVGASIYDFQPYVTEGTMPPPANPLVISQPCIRYTDVELVGPTGGRHMTIFEMGGAHAFNYPTKEVYWMDQCVRYHHQLLTEVLGVPSESVTYKEHFWSGGGNAGPDLETTYAITDHTKAATFLLADGVVPSNVGEGYLARLIIRRAGRFARQLGIFADLPSIVEAQIKLWGGDFRTLREMRSEIIEGLGHEMKKYQETISRGFEVVVRISKDLASKGVPNIPTDQLVQLYDSQGLPPEIVREAAEKSGVTVEIPDNFLTLVAESHSRPDKGDEEGRSDADIEAKLANLPATRPLYYDDPYKTTFKAKIVGKIAENALVLDQTAFYPQGGGQLADHGELKLADKKVLVVDVQKYGDRIVHYLAQPIDPTVDLVQGEIDWQRRQNLMRHHTGTHVLIGSSRRVLGEHVWQAGAQKEVESSRLDITHYQQITPKEREKIERLANQTILRDLPVRINWMAREKAEAKYGYRLYQGGAVPGGKIRVVRIVGWDTEACGGTHVKRTGELGVFRIEKIDRLQDGIERIIFSAGIPALKRISDENEELTTTAQLLKTTPGQVPKSAKALLAERDALQKELEKHFAKTLEAHIRQLQKRAKTLGPIKLVVTKGPKRKGMDPVEIANRLKESDKNMVAVIVEVSDRVQIVAAAGEEAVNAGINAGEIVSGAAKAVGGGGGGRQFFASGGGPLKEKAEEAMRIIEETIQRQLSTATAKEVA